MSGRRAYFDDRRSGPRRFQTRKIELPVSGNDVARLVQAGDISPDQARNYLELIAFRQRDGNRRNVEDGDTPDIIRPASFD